MVDRKFWVRMGLSGAGIAPAGVDYPEHGHHHLLVDADLPPPTEPIPNDKSHLHFGAGQTEGSARAAARQTQLAAIAGRCGAFPS